MQKLIFWAILTGLLLMLVGGLVGGAVYFWPKEKEKKISPEEAAGLFDKAREAETKDDLTTAQKLYQQASQAQPENLVYLEKFAQTTYGLGKINEAIEGYQKLVNQQKDNATAWNALGNLYRDAGQPDKSIKAYQEAIKLDPSFVVAYTNLANLYLLREEKDLAKQVLKEGLKVNPDNQELKKILEGVK